MPISLEAYTAQVREQIAQKTIVRAADLIRAFSPLVLSAEMFLRLGTAMVSGTSMFLYGPSGTGKTSIAACIAAAYEDTIWIPYAIEVDVRSLPFSTLAFTANRARHIGRR